MYPAEPSGGRPRRASVLIVGTGALGCPAAELLATHADVALTLVDDDRVEPSNLQRQILFDESHIGRPKVVAAAEALGKHRGGATIDAVEGRVDATNAAELVGRHDFVIDACDDPATKLLLNRACIETGTPLAYGGVARTGGQTMTVVPGASACLACVFPALDTHDDDRDSCSRMGILAPVAGVIGALQAMAAVETLSGSAGGGIMRIYELRGKRWRSVRFDRTPGCPACDGPRERGEIVQSRRPATCPT